ncbi:class I SAM-dependent DNA methyltransferase [Bacteroidota bacterium]
MINLCVNNTALEDWFSSWFNSPYYHILYKNRDNAEAAQFIDSLVDSLNLTRSSRVLDLACGKGRHSLQFRKKGFDVVGVDLSEESIAEAEQLKEDGLEFFVHDMRELYWRAYFDLVVNLFTSFGYFHDPIQDQQTIDSVADALKSQGLFVVDYMNVHKVIANLVEAEEKVIDGVQFKISRAVENDIIVKRIKVINASVELDFKEEVDALTLEDFKIYLESAGLDVQHLYGNYKLEPFNQNTSDRLIIVAKKGLDV